jgi:two-component system sensor histidine kinase DesK
VLWVIVVLSAALFVVGQMNWLTALAIAAAGAGRFAASWARAVIGVAVCAAVGAAVCVWHGLGYGATLAAFGVPLLVGLLAYSAERRNVIMFKLNQTRAELARMAVAEERLRISRDLHDLLGHSLSLIALKSELAGRMIESDPPRAAREIAELEAVARRSLAEVRQAVTGYRQPSLAAELAAARRMLAAAGIDCRVDAPGSYELPPEVDTLLAWTVREGSTNIVRHSGARHARITVTVTGATASAELTDDGAGPPAGRGAFAGGQAGQRGDAAGPAGSGLAGLAERAARLGGTLQAGAGARGGFRVRVTVPLTAASPPDQQRIPAAAAAPGTSPGVPGTVPAARDAPETDPDVPDPAEAPPAGADAPDTIPADPDIIPAAPDQVRR